MALKRLEVVHWDVITWLSLPKYGGKTIKEIAEICGCSDQAIYKWRRDPLFDRELTKTIVRNSKNKMAEVMDAVTRGAIEDGSAAHAKLFLQAHGALTDKVEVEQTNNNVAVDMDAMKARIEAFQRNQKDMPSIHAIEAEFSESDD